MNEEKINKITRIYYSNPSVQSALFSFGQQREVVPRYGEGFGKRPDSLQYASDIMGLVNRGATSFHASEELWSDPLRITTDLTPPEMAEHRVGWDLLIDIDSPYLDYSKIALQLVIEFLEKRGVFSYGIKFSGNKGFHLIVPFAAFPQIFHGEETRKMFPDWARAIVKYIMTSIRPQYNRLVADLGIDFKALERKTNLSKEDLMTNKCPTCGARSIEKQSVSFKCNRCRTSYERPDYEPTKRKLRCIDPTCPGTFEEVERKKYFYCEKCKTSSFNKFDTLQSSQKTVREKSAGNFSTAFEEEFDAEKLGSLDMVLVSPRHLFRMPYSLHEKTALASVVLDKSQISSFAPPHADPFKVKIRDFYLAPKKDEATLLLSQALEISAREEKVKEANLKQKYEYLETTPITGVTEDMFPQSIKKLLKGLTDGRKRGLFILITFLRCLNFSNDYITAKVYEWNKKNTIPLKEGYIRSQLEWHFRQTRKILPPNYENDSFYKDLGLIEEKPMVKNPLVEVLRKMRNQNN